MRRDRAAAQAQPRVARTGLTPKQEFDAVTGPERLWWRQCQDVVRGLPGKSRPGESAETRLNALFAAEERLAELGDEQASSADSARTFVSAVRMIAEITWLAAQGTDDDTRDDRLGAQARTARFWDNSGLLAPVAGGGHPDASQAMVQLTKLRLAGVRPRSRCATRIPVLFDKRGAGVSGALQIHHIPGGPPGLYPDPEAMTFVRADTEFTGALADAWFYATRGRVVDTCVIWRLDLNDGTAIPFLRGVSLGAAFAIALRDHFRKHLSLMRPWDPAYAYFFGLRPQCAVTGAIDVDETLAAVGGMEAKLAAARESRLRLVAPARNRDAAVHAPVGLHVYWARTLRQADRNTRRWHPIRTTIAGLAFALAVALFTITVINHQLKEAHDTVAATQLASVGPSLMASDPVASRLDAVTAWRLAPSEGTRMAMLNSAIQPQIAALGGLPSPADSVAFSPDGALLAVAFGQQGSGPTGVQLWNARTRQQAGRLEASTSSEVGNGFGPMAFSPNGRYLALGTDDGTVFLWDVASRHLAGRYATNPYDVGSSVSSLVFNPDAATLAVADIDGNVQFWNVAAGRQQGSTLPLTNGSTAVSAVAFSPDGATLVAIVPGATADKPDAPGKLAEWSVSDHREIGPEFSLGGSDSPILGAVAFSPDGKTLAIGSYAAQLWNVARHSHTAALPTPPGNLPQVDQLAFSSDGMTLALSYSTGVTEIGDTVTRQLITVLPAGGSTVRSLALRPDGSMLAVLTSDGTTHLWNTATASPFTAAAVVDSLAFSPGSHTLAATVPGHRGTVQLWDTSTGRPVGMLPSADTSGIGSAAFSPNGQVVAIGYNDGTAQLWDTATLQPLGKPLPYPGDFASGDDPEPPAFSFSPDGKTLLAGYFLGRAQLWNVATQSLVRKFQISDSVTATAFSPDGKTLAAASGQGVQLWNAASSQPLGAALSTPDTPSSLAFSPDGAIVAVGYDDGAVRFWSVATHQQIGASVPVVASSDEVDVMAFSPDGQTLAAGSYEGAVHLVDVSAPQVIGTALAEPGFAGAVQAMSFSLDGKALLVGTSHGTRLFDVDYLQDPATYLCALAGRTFTPAEWAKNVREVGYQNVCG
jgi:WD40 repeat protein